MIRERLFVGFLTSWILASVAHAAPLTLDEALDRSLRGHPDLTRALAQAEQSGAQAEAARAGRRPQMTATAAYQRSTANFVARPGSVPRQFGGTGSTSFDTFDFVNAGLTASWSVFDAAASDRVVAAEWSQVSQSLSVGLVRLRVARDVRVAYFDARAARALADVARETLANRERHLRQVEAFVQAGTRPPIDLAQVRTDFASARLEATRTASNESAALSNLRLAVGDPTLDTTEGVVDAPLAPVDGELQPVSVLIADALSHRPDLQAAEAQVRAQRARVDAARHGTLPEMGVSTGLTEAGTSLDQLAWNWNAGASLQWPLFQGGLSQAQIREARSGETVLEAQLRQLRQLVGADVETATLAVTSARQSIDTAREVLENARERLRLAEARYQTGVGNVIELSDAQLADSVAAGQQVRAEYDLSSARARLLFALGRPPVVTP